MSPYQDQVRMWGDWVKGSIDCGKASAYLSGVEQHKGTGGGMAESDRTDLPSASTAILVVVVGVAIILALLFLFQVLVVR